MLVGTLMRSLTRRLLFASFGGAALVGAGWFAYLLDESFYPPQPSIPPWGHRDGSRPWIYWGVANIFIWNRTTTPLLLLSREVACDRPNDLCGEMSERKEIAPHTTDDPFAIRSFLQAGRSRESLRLMWSGTGEELIVPMQLDVEPGMECDVEVEIFADRVTVSACIRPTRHSISSW